MQTTFPIWMTGPIHYQVYSISMLANMVIVTEGISRRLESVTAAPLRQLPRQAPQTLASRPDDSSLHPLSKPCTPQSSPHTVKARNANVWGPLRTLIMHIASSTLLCNTLATHRTHNHCLTTTRTTWIRITGNRTRTVCQTPTRGPPSAPRPTAQNTL